MPLGITLPHGGLSLPAAGTRAQEIKRPTFKWPTYPGIGDKGERCLKDSFICTINYFNGLSPITVVPTVRRAGVQIMRAIEKPWMVIIINTHNKNQPGRGIPRVLFYALLVSRLVALSSGTPRRRLGSSSGQDAGCEGMLLKASQRLDRACSTHGYLPAGPTGNKSRF